MSEVASEPALGDLRWFGALPVELYPPHEVYRAVIARIRAGELTGRVPLFTQHSGTRNPRPSEEGTIENDRSLRTI